MPGAQAIAPDATKRRGLSLAFCIQQHWNLAFSEMLTALRSQNCLRSQFILFYEPVILLFHRRIDANQGRLCCPVSYGAISFIISLCHYYTIGCFRMQAAIFHKECYVFSCIRQNFLFFAFHKLTFCFGRGRMNVFGGSAAGVGAVHGAAPIFCGKQPCIKG